MVESIIVVVEADEVELQECIVGMIQHEAPHIYDKGVIPYPAPYKDKSLESGMVLSIETDLKYDDVGFDKLEDTVVIKNDGFEAYGDDIRDWVCNENV